MTKVANFWRNHRLGMFYGALWAFAPMLILERIPLGNYYDGPDDFKQLPFDWLACLVMLAASLPTGVLVTWLFRRWLKDIRASRLWLWSPLALLIGTTLYGLLYSQFGWVFLKTSETWGELTLGSLIVHPAMSFFSIFAIVLIPLAGLNTWHLWRRVNDSPRH